MTGIAPRLPLDYNSADGPFTSITQFRELVEQNMKMLLLTSPGERMMIPDYGVGMRKYVFEQNTEMVKNTITTKIKNQLKRYMPYVTLEEIVIIDSQTNSNLDPYTIEILISYYVANLGQVQQLKLVGNTETRQVL